MDGDGLAEGDWIDLTTETGTVAAKLKIMDSMKQGHVRVPHGWWFPEMRGNDPMGGAFISSDAVLCPDSDKYLFGRSKELDDSFRHDQP
ncbi:MAG: molybdopterin dinucleotide binding domain-containing protein [Ilumatobacter sp.]